MSVNTMTFEQISTVLVSLVKQATGQTVLTPTSTSEFVSVAQIALRADRDVIMNTLSNMIGRTIFSIRPYSAKMTGLVMDSFRWGAVMRKLSIADNEWEDDQAYKYPVTYDAGQTPPSGDGGTVDQWVIKKPNVLQTNFYGASVYSDHMTITEEQLESAFTSPDQLGSFITLIMTNLSDRWEQAQENLRRGLVANAIGGIYNENNSDRVIHLLTEYNTLTGLTTPLDNQTVYQPDNFNPFMKWVYSRIAQISDLMTERSQMFQTRITGKPVMHHTPMQDQRVYLYAPARHQIDARVLADTYHDNFLRYADVESVNFWQSISSGSSVTVTPAWTDASGALVIPGSTVAVDDVFGIIFDRDFMGMTVLGQRMLSTPVNASGIYRNVFLHARNRLFTDPTEKACLLLLD